MLPKLHAGRTGLAKSDEQLIAEQPEHTRDVVRKVIDEHNTKVQSIRVRLLGEAMKYEGQVKLGKYSKSSNKMPHGVRGSFMVRAARIVALGQRTRRLNNKDKYTAVRAATRGGPRIPIPLRKARRLVMWKGLTTKRVPHTIVAHRSALRGAFYSALDAAAVARRIGNLAVIEACDAGLLSTALALDQAMKCIEFRRNEKWRINGKSEDELRADAEWEAYKRGELPEPKKGIGRCVIKVRKAEANHSFVLQAVLNAFGMPDGLGPVSKETVKIAGAALEWKIEGSNYSDPALWGDNPEFWEGAIPPWLKKEITLAKDFSEAA